MTVYTYVGFALFPKKDSASKPEPKKGKQDKNKASPREQTWTEGSKAVTRGALVGGGAGMLIGGTAAAIRFRRLVRELMRTNPNLTKEQAEDIVREKYSVGKGIAEGLSTITATYKNHTIENNFEIIEDYILSGNDIKAYRYHKQQNKKSGK